MSGALVELANLAVTQVGLRGIDWAALTAAGRGSVWDRDYINNYMLPAQVRMMGVIQTLDLNIIENPVNFKDNYTTNQDLMIDVAQFIASLGNPVGLLAMKVEARLSREAMRYLTSMVYQSANYGLLLHEDETIHHSGKTDQEIAAHADIIVGMMDAIYLLNAGDFYSLMGIKQGSAAPATSGLGLTGPIIAGIVVVAVAFLALVAWMIVNIVSLNATNNIVAGMCQKAQASGDTATTQQCVNTLTAATKAAGTVDLGSLFGKVLPYVAAGFGVYLLFLFAPAIVKSLTSSRSSA